MKRFYVEFIAEGYVIDIEERKIGFKEIEQAQQLWGQQIPIEKIFESVGPWQAKTYRIEMPRKVAQEEIVQVKVPVKALNKYVFISFDFEVYDEGDEVEAYPMHQVDVEQLLNDWVEAGCPLAWEV